MSINKIKIMIAGKLRRLVVFRYRMLGVQIGENVFVSHKAKIDTTYPGSIVIGDGCYITYGATILAHDHSVYRRIPRSQDNGKGRVILEENVFVGAHAIILRNVIICRNSIISAGAVVTKDVPPNAIVAGNPARIIGHFEMIEREK